MQINTHKESKLVSILTGSRDPDSARPVVVEVGELVGERLDVFGHQAGGVLHHIVGGWVDSALVHRLRHEEEVVPEQKRMYIKQTDQDRANLSGRVTSLSTTVPLGGLEGFPFILVMALITDETWKFICQQLKLLTS